MNKLGWIKDADDERDEGFAFHLLGLTAATQRSATVRPFLGKPFHQGRLGSCVSHAEAKLIYCSQVQQLADAAPVDIYEGEGDPPGPEMPDPERLAILAHYYLSRAAHNVELYDAGTHLRTGFRILNRFGFARESLWPYDDSKLGAVENKAPFQLMPPTRTFQQGIDRADGPLVVYRRITEAGYHRVDACKTALEHGFAVGFGTKVSRDFALGIWDGKPLDFPDQADWAGGHAMVLGEFADDVFGVLNSHGRASGDEGWWLFNADYIAHQESADFWVVERAPLWLP